MTKMSNMVKWLLATLLMALSLGVSAAEDDNNAYVLGAGDQIRVTVYQNPDLLIETRIPEGGAISFPLLGTVQIGGLTVADAEKKIATGLKDGKFLKQPQVAILVIAVKANQVSVLGQVNRPGRYPLEAGNSRLSEVLALAGGIVPGVGSDIVVVSGMRDGQPFRWEVDFPKVFATQGTVEDLKLQNGDSIWIDRAPQIYVYGEVQRPGAQILMRDTTVLQALATAGGLTLRGTERGIRVHRRDASGEVKIIQPGMNDKLQPADIIYIKESLF